MTAAAAAMMLLAAACAGREGRPAADTAVAVGDSAVQDAPADYTRQALGWADSLMAGMDMRRMAGQLVMPALYAAADASSVARVREYVDSCHVGGIILLKGSMEGAAALADTVQRLSAVPLWVAIDAEWGLAMRLADAPEFPANRRLGAVADDQLLYDYGYEMARECRRLGINMLFGPVLDVTGARGGPIGIRSFGSDARQVARLAVAYARGVEDGAVISVAKHFPGHGLPSADSHNTLPVIHRSLRQLDSVDLVPFRAYIDAGLSAVMVGHLAVPAIDPEMRSAAVSPVVIGDLLRGELGFSGLVLTDALNMAGASGAPAVSAVRAGADIVLSPAHTAREIDEIVAAVRAGKIDSAAVARSCRRVLFYKYKAGLDAPRRVSPHGIRRDVASPDADTLRHRLRRAAR